jgi:hypothetical protein
MIKDIPVKFLKSYKFDENSYLDSSVLNEFGEYFDVVLSKASLQEQMQWYYNMFKVGVYVDTGFAHVLQHHHTTREYITYCNDNELASKAFSGAYGSVIGANTDRKPVGGGTIEPVDDGYILDGEVPWVTNALSANYLITICLDKSDNVLKRVLVDLDKVEHTASNPFSKPIGMSYARPGVITFDNQIIPKEWQIGVVDWPVWDEDMFRLRVLTSLCFLTNMAANIQSLFNEVEEFALNQERHNEIAVLKVKNNVMTFIDVWINRLQQYKNIKNDQLFFQSYHQIYVFGKKTLIEVINLSRELGIQKHSFDGEPSRVYRNAMTFSSHMTKLQEFKNVWGQSKVFNTEQYIKHLMNYHINGIEIPTDLY